MKVALDSYQLKDLAQCLKNGDYYGNDVMQARLAINELIEARKTLEDFKAAYVELSNSVSFADNGESAYVADQQLMSKFDAAFDRA